VYAEEKKNFSEGVGGCSTNSTTNSSGGSGGGSGVDLSSHKNLKILKDDPVKGAVIENLTEVVVTSAEQALAVLVDGESARHVGR
jgi:hypothetical protein